MDCHGLPLQYCIGDPNVPSDWYNATGGFSPIIVTGLTNGVEYTFTVTATNVIGTSEASAPSNVVTPSVKTGIATVETWRTPSLHAVSIYGGLQILKEKGCTQAPFSLFPFSFLLFPFSVLSGPVFTV
jgi:hypothetical protein